MYTAFCWQLAHHPTIEKHLRLASSVGIHEVSAISRAGYGWGAGARSGAAMDKACDVFANDGEQGMPIHLTIEDHECSRHINKNPGKTPAVLHTFQVT